VDEATENVDAVPDDAVSAAEAEVTAHLDPVYESEPSALDPGLHTVLRRSLARSSW
jgi:hypothetical protein